ncbi:unnamed protein product [Mycena citricolor]|uniref:Uncharacterized protein n=1 Tax=Mycena citricolor TaxID=2018698 RepID=A0AAD2GQD4_9AGAR|nr:unnamed protein product [Mycena citricolor]
MDGTDHHHRSHSFIQPFRVLWRELADTENPGALRFPTAPDGLQLRVCSNHLRTRTHARPKVRAVPILFSTAAPDRARRLRSLHGFAQRVSE